LRFSRRESPAGAGSASRAYGIRGFCYYHYCFNGKRILERPLDQVLRPGLPTFRFTFWADEPWVRSWTSQPEETLIPQSDGEGWETRLFLDALPYLKDRRNITVKGMPCSSYPVPLPSPTLNAAQRSGEHWPRRTDSMVFISPPSSPRTWSPPGCVVSTRPWNFRRSVRRSSGTQGTFVTLDPYRSLPVRRSSQASLQQPSGRRALDF
jgi:hypothetical protein